MLDVSSTSIRLTSIESFADHEPGTWNPEPGTSITSFSCSGCTEDVSQSVVVLVAFERKDRIRIGSKRHGDRPRPGPRLRIVEGGGPLDAIRRHASEAFDDAERVGIGVAIGRCA